MNNEINASSSAIIIKELTKADITIETSYSFIMLGEKDAYKFYKPSDFCLVENRLNNNRKKYTMFEADFNQKFSQNIYGDVFKIIRQSEKEFGLVPLHNSLAAIDYIVKMNRVDDKYKLSNLMFNNSLNESDYNVIGQNLFQILDSQERYVLEKDLYSKYLKDFINSILTYIKDNGKILYKDNQDRLSLCNDLINKFEDYFFPFIENNEDKLEHRYNSGFIKQGHGNIKLKHILYNSPYSAVQYGNNMKIGLMDANIFNVKYRNIDVMLEIMNLLVDYDFISNSNDNLTYYLANNYHVETNTFDYSDFRNKDYINVVLKSFEAELKNKYGEDGFNNELVSFYYKLAYLIKFVEVFSFLKDANSEWSFYNDLTEYLLNRIRLILEK